METIHPNDIQELDADTFSFITLKNGNMIMIDDSVPQKAKTIKSKNDNDSQKIERIPQDLKVSDQLTISFRGKEPENNINFNDNYNQNNDNKIIVKSDFNLLSKITENVNFSFFGNPIHKPINNIPMISINKNENENHSDNNEKTDRSNITKSLNTFSPILSSNTNIKANENQNILLNNKNKNDEDENNTSSNRINSKNEENKEGENENDVGSRIRRKSRNYIEKIEKLVGDRNRHTVKAVISLNIPSDVTRERSSTQKQFDKLVAQFRQKQSKYRKDKNDLIYQKYYELYKDKDSKLYNGPNINRIKYYHEAEAEDIENDILFSSNEINSKNELNSNNNLMVNNTYNNTFCGGFNNNINKSFNYNIINPSFDYNLNKTMNSFNGAKTRISSENKILNNKLVGSSIGYSSALVYPSNRFIRKIGNYY